MIKVKLLPTEGCLGLSCGSYEHEDELNEVSKDFRELNAFFSMFFFFF